MSTPSAWPSVMNWTYGVAIPLYWACGIVGYYAYGDFSWSNINLNFPDSAANRISIGVTGVEIAPPLPRSHLRCRPLIVQRLLWSAG